jgi:hypothetical protein
LAFVDAIADLIAWVDQPAPRFVGHTHTVGCTLFHALVTDCWQGNLFYRSSGKHEHEHEDEDEDSKKAKRVTVLEGVLFVFPQTENFPSFQLNQVCALLTIPLAPEGDMSIALTSLAHPGIPDRTAISSQFIIPLPTCAFNSGTVTFECSGVDNWLMELYKACADYSCDHAGHKN